MTELKVTLVGDPTVGKTSLLTRYKSDTFPIETHIDCARPDDYSGVQTIAKVIYLVTPCDTKCHEDYDKIRPLQYINTDAFIVCFALDNRISLENVTKKWVTEVQHHCPQTPIILVGTKMDVSDDSKITPKEGQSLCEKLSLSYYVECSSKTGEGIQNVITKAILATVKPFKVKKKKKCIIM